MACGRRPPPLIADEAALLGRFAELLGDRLGQRVYEVFDQAAKELRLERLTPWFAIHSEDLTWLDGRRAIKSFFMAEVDRGKVVVVGSR